MEAIHLPVSAGGAESLGFRVLMECCGGREVTLPGSRRQSRRPGRTGFPGACLRVPREQVCQLLPHVERAGKYLRCPQGPGRGFGRTPPGLPRPTEGRPPLCPLGCSLAPLPTAPSPPPPCASGQY